MVASSPFAGPSRLLRSLARSRAARFARPNRRACSPAIPLGTPPHLFILDLTCFIYLQDQCRAHSKFPLAFLLSSIFYHVSGVIHCLFFFFLKPRTLSVVSWHTFTITVTPGCFNNVLIFSIFNFKCTEAISRLNSELPFNLRAQSLMSNTLCCCLVVRFAHNFNL